MFIWNATRWVWAWANATALHAYISVVIFGMIVALVNLVIEKKTNTNWDALAAKHPRFAGVLLMMKALGPVLTIFWRGFVAAVTGDLKARAAGGPGKSLNDLVKQVETTRDDSP